ncbi:hypothetical protein GCM10023346_44680 [Arthrobacter gyeryongensis]|uniref:Uncharacterized protein n=1 Tax=Arthrobacter gyeryongensis TaxID=1650592 RepID=A0ABP9SRV0_9MICC
MAKNAITIAPPNAAESTPTPPFMTAATADVAARAATAVVELRKRSRSHSEEVERGAATPLESDCCPPALEVMGMPIVVAKMPKSQKGWVRGRVTVRPRILHEIEL